MGAGRRRYSRPGRRHGAPGRAGAAQDRHGLEFSGFLSLPAERPPQCANRAFTNVNSRLIWRS
jgi:hypothetical protein